MKNAKLKTAAAPARGKKPPKTAYSKDEIEEIFAMVRPGTPILITP